MCSTLAGAPTTKPRFCWGRYEMANPRPIPAHPGDLDGLPVSRLEDLALDVPLTQAPGTDEIPDGSLPLAVKLYEVRKPYNQWLYGYFIELRHIGPVDVGPLLPEPHRCDNIDCIECWNKSVRYEDYRKAKRLRDINGF